VSELDTLKRRYADITAQAAWLREEVARMRADKMQALAAYTLLEAEEAERKAARLLEYIGEVMAAEEATTKGR
jgi:hypothetical protein